MSLFSKADRFTRTRMAPASHPVGNGSSSKTLDNDNSKSQMAGSIGGIEAGRIDAVLDKIRNDMAVVQEDCRKKQEKLEVIERKMGPAKDESRVLLTARIIH